LPKVNNGRGYKNKTPGTRAFFANRPEFCFERKKQNSGNQPEFQSSIKKRTVNQTVVAVKFQFFKFQTPIVGIWGL
jgi:hypothetical protein